MREETPSNAESRISCILHELWLLALMQHFPFNVLFKALCGSALTEAMSLNAN